MVPQYNKNGSLAHRVILKNGDPLIQYDYIFIICGHLSTDTRIERIPHRDDYWAYNISTLDSNAGGFLRVQGQSVYI